MKPWKALFRFSLAELLVGMLLFAGLFLTVNKQHTDEVFTMIHAGGASGAGLEMKVSPLK